ncbi:MAG: DUF3179 domain-containing protein [Planctomycetota bacterium]
MGLRTCKIRILSVVTIALALSATGADERRVSGEGYHRRPRQARLPGWNTNTAKRLIELYELEAGGPGKDGIPAIDNPRFTETHKARMWLRPAEPVIAVAVDGQAKAYPLQILIWHEIINDRIGDVPLLVTFCPLCYSANVYERTVEQKQYSFGVSGMLRYSNLVMYDRQTETLWQQVTGKALVGDMVGSTLKSIPAQIISFDQFRSAYKDGLVLSRKTGYRRNYGRNPYVGYDDISKRPFMLRAQTDDRLRPMEKIVTVSINGANKAYPYGITRKRRVINDVVGGKPMVVFHDKAAVSALDQPYMARSRQVGSTGVFQREVDGQRLSFRYKDGEFYDDQTESIWNITGQAVQGPLEGKKLTPVAHGDYFAFVCLVFKPETDIYR